MILDTLDQAARYERLHPGLPAAFRFLGQARAVELAPGRHEIDGRRLMAVVVREPGRGRDQAKLEVHRQYMDIQLAVSGTDVIGWKAAGRCTQPAGAFDASKDVGFFQDAPEAWIAVPPGVWALFFPADAHAPLAGQGPLHKLVVKVAVDW